MKTTGKIIGVLAILIIFASNLLAQQTEERNVGSFSKVSVSGAMDVFLKEGDKEMLTVEAKGIEMDKIITEVDGGELKIKLKDNNWDWWGKNTTVKVYVTYKSLTAIRNSGSSDVVCNSVLKAETFEVKVSGSGNFTGEVATKDLTVSISGSADVNLKGSADKQDISISGSGDLEAKNLEGKNVKVSVSGSGNANVWATESIEARVSGSGDVQYKGNPTKEITKATGSGSVSRRN
jgi:hypothetical protein